MEPYNGLASLVEASRGMETSGFRLWKRACTYYVCLVWGCGADAFVKPYRLICCVRSESMELEGLLKAEWAELFEKGETVVNCASDEFSSL